MDLMVSMSEEILPPTMSSRVGAEEGGVIVAVVGTKPRTDGAADVIGMPPTNGVVSVIPEGLAGGLEVGSGC